LFPVQFASAINFWDTPIPYILYSLHICTFRIFPCKCASFRAACVYFTSFECKYNYLAIKPACLSSNLCIFSSKIGCSGQACYNSLPNELIQLYIIEITICYTIYLSYKTLDCQLVLEMFNCEYHTRVNCLFPFKCLGGLAFKIYYYKYDHDVVLKVIKLSCNY